MIYLATPYTHADPDVMQARFEQACRIAARLMDAGETVCSPVAHSHSIAVHGGLSLTDLDFWMRQDREFLTACSKVVVVKMDGWSESAGIRREIAMARRLDIPVEFMECE